VDRDGQYFTLYQRGNLSMPVRSYPKKPTLPLSHGGNTGSNPVGDANNFNMLDPIFLLGIRLVRQIYGKDAPGTWVDGSTGERTSFRALRDPNHRALQHADATERAPRYRRRDADAANVGDALPPAAPARKITPVGERGFPPCQRREPALRLRGRLYVGERSSAGHPVH
jgi:hypothetical protein